MDCSDDVVRRRRFPGSGGLGKSARSLSERNADCRRCDLRGGAIFEVQPRLRGTTGSDGMKAMAVRLRTSMAAIAAPLSAPEDNGNSGRPGRRLAALLLPPFLPIHRSLHRPRARHRIGVPDAPQAPHLRPHLRPSAFLSPRPRAPRRRSQGVGPTGTRKSPTSTFNPSLALLPATGSTSRSNLPRPAGRRHAASDPSRRRGPWARCRRHWTGPRRSA